MTWRRCRMLLAVWLTVLPILAVCQDSAQSLGDVARKLRKDNTEEVRMTEADTRKLFASVE